MRNQNRSLVFNIISFLGLCLSFNMANGKDVGFRCRSVYSNPTVATQTVYSGVLVELANREQSLVFVQNSWGPGHETALRHMVLKHDETNPVFKVLWMGEFSLRDNSQGKPKLVVVNDISGTYYKSLSSPNSFDIPFENDVKAMQSFVAYKGVWDAAQTRFSPFKESQSHLDWTSEYLKQKLNLSNTAHDIGSVFSRVISSGELMAMDKDMHDQFLPVLKTELEKYKMILEVLVYETGFDKKLVDRILELSGLVMTGDLHPKQLEEFNKLNRQLLDGWRRHSNLLESQMQII